MKTSLSSSFRTLLAGLALGTAAIAFAEPPGPAYETLHQTQQFQQLKAGDRIVYVCNQCKNVTEQTIGSAAQAMEYCKEVGTVTCPFCKAKVRIVSKGPPKNPMIQREVIYTNDKGEECVFIAKVINKG